MKTSEPTIRIAVVKTRNNSNASNLETYLENSLMNASAVDRDIYVIPISNGKNLIYSPLRRLLFWANEEVCNIINEYLNGGIEIPPSYGKLSKNFKKIENKQVLLPQSRKIRMSETVVIILSQKCNLACAYCYAKNTHSSDTLDKLKLQTIIHSVVTASSEKTRDFSFIGGGEPTVTWELFKWAVEHIRTEIKRIGVKSRIGLATNATLLNNERVIWLKENNVHVSVSFDILPDAQNSQRSFPDKAQKSFDSVDEGIKLLIANKVPTRIRSTITVQNVCLMKDMVEFSARHYPEIKWLHFEHVTDLGLTQKKYYDDFVSHFFMAKEVASAVGIKLKNSIITSVRQIKTRFCGGEFCITPTGKLVSCHRVSSEKSKLFDLFSYGNVTDILDVDTDALERVERCFDDKLDKCVTCFARWNCAGMCTYNRCLFSPEQLSLYCEFTKRMIVAELESKLTSG